ncbi:Exportin-1 [Fusarium oxysporum f. sp. albedinis]|nr:Exportin-1 [Fusarium oxysporum f. sp. albedinis]
MKHPCHEVSELGISVIIIIRAAECYTTSEAHYVQQILSDVIQPGSNQLSRFLHLPLRVPGPRLTARNGAELSMRDGGYHGRGGV